MTSVVREWLVAATASLPSLVTLCLLGALACEACAGDIAKGGELYARHCAGCHGNDGRPVMPMAPDLSQPTALLKPDPMLLTSLRAGKGAMPAYRGVLRDRELLDIVAYLRTMR